MLLLLGMCGSALWLSILIVRMWLAIEMCIMCVDCGIVDCVLIHDVVVIVVVWVCRCCCCCHCHCDMS